uniref:Uncharacterized protein n=1 Tax=uncultured marine virus TaxID=186617 RepID=A0A0F7L5T8_9VIRU|nr:hypothetical protein [uncultured marine virus]
MSVPPAGSTPSRQAAILLRSTLSSTIAAFRLHCLRVMPNSKLPNPLSSNTCWCALSC